MTEPKANLLKSKHCSLVLQCTGGEGVHFTESSNTGLLLLKQQKSWVALATSTKSTDYFGGKWTFHDFRCCQDSPQSVSSTVLAEPVSAFLM